MVPEPSPDHPEFILAREWWRQHCWEFYAGSSKPNFSCRGCTLPGWCCEDILSCWDLYHFFLSLLAIYESFLCLPGDSSRRKVNVLTTEPVPLCSRLLASFLVEIQWKETAVEWRRQTSVIMSRAIIR